MSIRTISLQQVSLNPGEMHFGECPSVVNAVLGTCVSVTLFSRRMSIGAICHGVLPECAVKQHCEQGCSERLKYVECSVERMLEQFSARGVSVNEIDAGIFGGADMFDAATTGRLVSTVGFRNFNAALRVTQKTGVKVVSTDVGGIHGRQIAFYSHTGEVFLKRLNKRDCQVHLAP